MFDPERLLGQLLTKGIRHGARKRGISLGTKATLGMGAIGVAMAAYEHFTKDAAGSASTSSPSSTPPVPPTTKPAAPPPLPPLPPSSPTSNAISPGDPEAVATLLIRAMIAAANADGTVDEEETSRILDGVTKDGMDYEDRAFLVRELDKPLSIDQIVSTTGKDEALRQQVYVASLAAVDVDTEAERDYLKELAAKLDLGDELIEEIHQSLQ